ncbi:MAG TPA: hypothetical protein VK803_03170 [Steroidobacteraceae bacterium]|jgi:probable HAF family extracellular repeat protein|nr:hypothetical protein [Steroidobacteraceae bacterium]
MHRRWLRGAGALAVGGCCICASAAAPPLPSYMLTPIPIPAAAASVTATAINASGEVTGSIGFATQPAHVFLFSQGALSDLGTLTYPGLALPGAASGQSINASGVIVGTFMDPVNQLWSFGFTYSNGTLAPLLIASGYTNCTATGLDAAGLIIGGCTSPQSAVSAFAAIYVDGMPQAIGPAGGSANAVNDYGQVAAFGTSGGFIYDNVSAAVTAIPALAAAASMQPAVPAAINNAGQVVGWQAVSAGFAAFLYVDGATLPLTAVPDSTVMSALSINNAGQIAGSTVATAAGAAMPFFLANGTLSNLNALVDAADPNKPFVTLTAANAINDRGWIAATGVDSRTAQTAGYLLIPVTPFPVSVAVLAAATAVTGTSFTIAWTAQSATACTASGGSGSDGWKGSATADGGQLQLTETAAGTYDFTLQCTGANGVASSTAKVTVAAAMTPGLKGSSGGGALGLDTLAALLALLGLRCVHRQRAQAPMLVSSAIISSRRSRSGTSGVSFTMRTWQMTGMRSAKPRELSGRTTSELTRTSCGKPWLMSAKWPPSTRVPRAWRITMRVRPLAGGIICPHAPSKEISGTALPFQGTVPTYHGGAPVISEGV